ncbi:MAG: ABC transporter permease subunit [Treponema sp.]|nr:ABC transporter permease subunit [Treponema sp.]
MNIPSPRRWFWGILGVGAFIVLWAGGAHLYGSALIFPEPSLVLGRFWGLLRSPAFPSALGGSFLRVLLSLAIAVPLGVALGVGSALDRRLGAFFRPLFAVVAAAPIIALILMAFLILGTNRTPVFTAVLMIFPLMAASTAEGIRNTDPLLIELCKSYRLDLSARLRFLYLPSLIPYILGSLGHSLSLSWKAVVAAEVIVQPLQSMGLMMQRARSNLDTAELFAWTAAVVMAAALFRFLFGLALRRLGVRQLSASSGVIPRGGERGV